MTSAPRSEQELLVNVAGIAGKTLQQIANQENIEPPNQHSNNKGWVGQLIEISLGATAASLPEPDFQHIGVELKTLALNHNRLPKESTHVCLVDLTDQQSRWETCLVKRKLSRVLWVPIEAGPEIPLLARRVGSAILWSPDTQQTAALRRDWEELMEMVTTGKLEEITAHQGQYLQIRPKAANARALCKGFNHLGEEILTLPRGFYLRTTFTRQILLR